MRRVKLRGLSLKSRPSNPNLVLIFCIRETQEENPPSKILESIRVFQDLISEIRDHYPNRKIEIILADTLDNHNREVRNAFDDGNEWVKRHKPVLDEMQLKETEDYAITRWSDYFNEAKGFIEKFKKAVDELGLKDKVDKIARKFHKKKNPAFDTMSITRQEKLIEDSFEYMAEDYGVTFYIANVFTPALFFQLTPSGDRMELVKKLNNSSMMGDSRVFFQSYYPIETENSNNTEHDSTLLSNNRNTFLQVSKEQRDNRTFIEREKVKETLKFLSENFDKLDSSVQIFLTANVSMLSMALGHDVPQNINSLENRNNGTISLKPST